MSKILLIGDNHHGANGNSKRLMRQAEHFYKSFLVNVINHYDIEFCVDLGDFFDDREKVDIEVLSHVRNVILKDLPVKWYFTVGNHNLYYKNSDHVNNLIETIGDINNVIVKSFLMNNMVELKNVSNNPEWKPIIDLAQNKVEKRAKALF